MNSFHHWFYERYWWLLLVLFGVTFCLPLASGALREPFTAAALFGINVAAFYFAQKQRLADQRLTAELLMHYNRALAERLPKVQAIHGEGDAAELLPDQRADLMAYFDLCGQLHLHFTRHHIPPDAWQSWLNRMRIYYYNPRIRRVWDAELKKDIYYGFDPQLLK